MFGNLLIKSPHYVANIKTANSMALAKSMSMNKTVNPWVYGQSTSIHRHTVNLLSVHG